MATMSDTEVKAALADVPGWELAGSDIVREYKFADFVAAIAFVNQVADKAEEANHHPDIDIRWRNVIIYLTTHEAGGVTERDLAMARKIEEIASGG